MPLIHVLDKMGLNNNEAGKNVAAVVGLAGIVVGNLVYSIANRYFAAEISTGEQRERATAPATTRRRRRGPSSEQLTTEPPLIDDRIRLTQETDDARDAC